MSEIGKVCQFMTYAQKLKFPLSYIVRPKLEISDTSKKVTIVWTSGRLQNVLIHVIVIKRSFLDVGFSNMQAKSTVRYSLMQPLK